MQKRCDGSGLETFLWSHYYFYLTVIKTRLHKDSKSAAPLCARRVRTVWLGLCVLTVVACLTLLTAGSSASSVSGRFVSGPAASPQLVMERTRRDFGEVFIGEELSQVFTVRNVGTAPLELANKTLAAQSQASR
ncbi:MAG TPA: hypothetical protein VF747_11850, partial [Blastocatellia bacterium]